MGSGVQRSPTKPANTSSHCCPSTAEAVANGGSTAPSSTASSGTSRGPARPGATCPKGTRSLADLCYDRFVRCRRRDGTRDRLLSHARTKNDAVGGVEWEVSVDDDTVIRAHQHHAAGARGEPRARRTKKGALEPRRRGPGTHQRRFPHREVAPRLRWQEEGQAAAAVRGPHPRSASWQQHPTRGTVLDAVRVPRPQGSPGVGRASGLPTPARRQGLQSFARVVSKAAATTQARHPPHRPRARRPEGAPRGASGTPARRFRPRGLPQARRGREVRERAQAVASDSDALREAGARLPGDGGHRASLMMWLPS